ncbi:MAG: hypothetical protein ABI661_12730, partial [Gammaproteobacteria bacterium]
MVGIERGFYDLCLRLSAGAAKAPVVIVSPDNANGDLWTLSRLDELIADIKAGGATAIIPAAAAPPLVATDDVKRLQSLIRLEARGGTFRSVAEPGLLNRQLVEAVQRINQQQRVATAIRAAGNVVLGLATTERRPGTAPGSGPCIDRVNAAGGRFAAPDGGRPNPAAIVPTAGMLCEVAAAIGHVALLT